MRLLHTSDWHLGRSFHREDLLGAQATFVDWLLEVVRVERVDAVLVSGDLYDRALPSVDAVALCDETLRRLAATGVRTVIISGNHDSARRLGFGADLIDSAGVHLRTDPARVGEPVLLQDQHGLVAAYGIPYLEPEAVRLELGSAEAGHRAVLASAMGRVRADLATRGPRARAVVLAHAFVTGGSPSDSERDISVGGAASVPVSTFTGVHYTALGHLHGAQQMAPSTRYSGSPLAYSFSEAAQRKSVTLVELGPRAVSSIQLLACPVPRRLGTLRGPLDDLLSDASLAGVEDCWLAVTLTDAQRPRDAMERLRSRFPHTLQIAFAPEGAPGERAERTYGQRVGGRGDLEVARSFVEHVRGTAATEAESCLLREAIEDARLVEAGL